MTWTGMRRRPRRLVVGVVVPRQVTAGSGGTGRFVVTGRDRLGHVVAYTSTDNGATWAQSEGFGAVPSA